MEIVKTFFEGILVFLSPCILPVMPILIAYLVNESNNENNKEIKNNTKKYINTNLLLFILGFTLVFVLLGVLAGSLGVLLTKNLVYINIVFGIVLLILGINYSGIFKIKILNKTLKINNNVQEKINGKSKLKDSINSILLGIFFAIGWSPCTGPFLTMALTQAANSNQIVGGYMLLGYSLGIAVPLYLTYIFLNELKNVFNIIKKNYNLINKVTGIIFILTGIYMIVESILKLV